MKVVATLNSLCVEMDNRYALLKEASMRNIKEYNDKFIHRHLNPEKGHRFLPYIVVIVDEFADLIMTAGKEVETPIARDSTKGSCCWHTHDSCHPAPLDKCHHRCHQS